MMQPSLTRILQGIEQVTRSEMLKDFRPDCCIATARTLQRVLKYFGKPACVLEVRVVVWNSKLVTALLQGRAKPATDPDFKQWCELTGCWSVGLGFEVANQAGYVGHLVAGLPEQGILIDASLDQASRPHKGIELPPVLIIKQVPPDFFTTAQSRMSFEDENKAQLMYERISNPDFRTSPDWTNKHRTKRAMRAIISHIESGVQ